MSDTPRTITPAQHYLEREIAEVQTAIALVGAGHAVTVSLGGLGHGKALLAALGDEAARAGVVIEAIWAWEEDRCDLIIRKVEPGVAGAASETGDG